MHKETRANTPEEVAASVCGINAQRGVTIYLSFWNRMRHFRKEDLDRALYQTRELVKIWCMRGTVHIVPSSQFSVYRATAPWRLWLPSDISEDFCQEIVNILDEPLTKSEIADRIKSKVSMSTKELRIKVDRAVRMLGYKGIVVFGSSLGKGFFLREYEFALAENWLPQENIAASEEEARKILLENYMKCYGPATVQDFAYWAGFKVGEARKICESTDLENIVVGGKRYCMIPGDSMCETDEEHQAVLLPEYDSYVMGHKDKSRIIEESFRSQVFLPFAQVDPVVVKDGRVIGTWKMKKEKDTFVFQVKPFEKVESDDADSIHGEINRIAQFMNLRYRISKNE